ncbi:uncharacterized protein LOC144916197 isoform X1 [Branchiostoma floridae x Branchiostoma belcheri]
MTTEPKEEVRGVEGKIKQSQGGEPANSDSHLRRDATTLQETLLAMHKLFVEKKEDTSPSIREFAELLQVAQEQADVSEDELVRSSFRNAELEMLLADEKLQANDASVHHERELSESHADLEMAIYELQQEKNRCAQKNLQIEDLKAQVAVLKTGGACFGSREEARCHISALEAEELAFRIAELEVLLEEQRNEANMLRAQLQTVQQTQVSEEEYEQQGNFLPEYLLTSCPSPSKEEETFDIEKQKESLLPEYLLASCPSVTREKEKADVEQQSDSFLPEYLLASCPSPSKVKETADVEQQSDSSLPEYLLSSCPSPSKEEKTADVEQKSDSSLPEYLLASYPSPSKVKETADVEQQSDSSLPEYLLASCPSPSKVKETADVEQESDSSLPEYLLASCPSPSKVKETADVEQESDSSLPEYLLASCPSPSKEEEAAAADIEQHNNSLLPEYLLACCPSTSKVKEIADVEQESDSSLPEYLLACCPSTSKVKEIADVEQESDSSLPEYLLACYPSTSKVKETADVEQESDSSLPECLLASCPSLSKVKETADVEQQNDSSLPEYLLASCPSPSKEEKTADIEQESDSSLPECLLAGCPSPNIEEDTAEIELEDDSFLPECLLASCSSSRKEEETADIEQQGISLQEDWLEDQSDIAPFLEELLINSRSPLQADSVSALDQESQDILRLSELLSSTASLESSCDGSQLDLEFPDAKMANPLASVKEKTQAPEGVKCGGLLQSILEEAQHILSLSASSVAVPYHDETEPIKVQHGQVVKTPLPTGQTYWTTVEPLRGSCCYTTTYISSNKDITVYQQL